MGHVTAFKGASRFEVAAGWQGKTSDRMKVRGYCSYKVTMPPGKSFAGEKLLLCFNTDALRAMEHQGGLIAIAHDIRLKQRRPIGPQRPGTRRQQLQPVPRLSLRRQRGQCGQILQGTWTERFLLGTWRAGPAGKFRFVRTWRRPPNPGPARGQGPAGGGRPAGRRESRPGRLPGRVLSPDPRAILRNDHGNQGHRFLQSPDDPALAGARVCVGCRP